jgi:hypothetical protein
MKFQPLKDSLFGFGRFNIILLILSSKSENGRLSEQKTIEIALHCIAINRKTLKITFFHKCNTCKRVDCGNLA